jgi:hypothetical protein
MKLGPCCSWSLNLLESQDEQDLAIDQSDSSINSMTNKIQTSAPEKTGQKQDGRFRPGASGNPAGRPKGARSRLGERFIEALASDFEEHGVATIEKVRTRDPTAYTKIIAGILPREVVVAALNVNATIDPSQIEDAQGFLAAYRFARDRIGAAPLIEAEPIHAAEGAFDAEGWKVIDDD